MWTDVSFNRNHLQWSGTYHEVWERLKITSPILYTPTYTNANEIVVEVGLGWWRTVVNLRRWNIWNMKMQTYYNASAICISINTNLNIFDKILLAWLFLRWTTSLFPRSPMALDYRPRVTTFPGRKKYLGFDITSRLCVVCCQAISHHHADQWSLISLIMTWWSDRASDRCRRCALQSSLIPWGWSSWW